MTKTHIQKASKNQRKNPARMQPAAATVAATMKADLGAGFKGLKPAQQRKILAMILFKGDPARAMEPNRLIPKGSVLDLVARGFRDTDINPLLGVFYFVSLAASELTQRGAVLDLPGIAPIRPTLWTICQAPSGSSKTLASDMVNRAINPDGGSPVRRMPAMGTSAQWIIDFAENNGALWFQDEVGKAFKLILQNTHHNQIKNWLLDAYSHNPISNRLKSETKKLTIEDPHLTFFGLTVTETWRHDIDLVSMLDGFCQRFNYAVIGPRTDRDIFDVFLYEPRFSENLAEIWIALCAQNGAGGPYTLADDVRPLLEEWWRGLRGEWGDFQLPASFIRRIGFSTLRYLMVLHFMLGKAGRPIDRETAILATRFAEFHLHSARMMLQSYEKDVAGAARLVRSKAETLEAEGKPVTARSVHNRLSKAQRLGLDVAAIAQLLEAMQAVEVDGQLIGGFGGQSTEKADAIMNAVDAVEARLRATERKRNERRLRELLAFHRARSRAAEMKERGGNLDHGHIRHLNNILSFERGAA